MAAAMRCKKVLSLVGLGAVAVALTPATAAASADGCAGHPSSAVHSCVRVIGSGLKVDRVSGGVNLPSRATFRGSVRVWGPGFGYRSGQRTIWNESYLFRTLWHSTWSFNRNFADGSRICAQAIWYDGKGEDIACVTIKR